MSESFRSAERTSARKPNSKQSRAPQLLFPNCCYHQSYPKAFCLFSEKEHHLSHGWGLFRPMPPPTESVTATPVLRGTCVSSLGILGELFSANRAVCRLHRPPKKCAGLKGRDRCHPTCLIMFLHVPHSAETHGNPPKDSSCCPLPRLAFFLVRGRVGRPVTTISLPPPRSLFLEWPGLRATGGMNVKAVIFFFRSVKKDIRNNSSVRSVFVQLLFVRRETAYEP